MIGSNNRVCVRSRRHTIVLLALDWVRGEGAEGRCGEGGCENWEVGGEEGEGVRGDIITERRADS